MMAVRAARQGRIGLGAAKETVVRSERIVLGIRDTARVLRLLGNPPKPTRALMAAAVRRARRK